MKLAFKKFAACAQKSKAFKKRKDILSKSIELRRILRFFNSLKIICFRNKIYRAKLEKSRLHYEKFLRIRGFLSFKIFMTQRKIEIMSQYKAMEFQRIKRVQKAFFGLKSNVEVSLKQRLSIEKLQSSITKNQTLQFFQNLRAFST